MGGSISSCKSSFQGIYRFPLLKPTSNWISSTDLLYPRSTRSNLKKTLPPFPPDYFLDIIEPSIDPSITQGLQPAPHLRICILIVGSRGDVQPYLSLALTFILRGGHTVRLCTHGDFKEFVLGTGRRVLGGRYEVEVGQGRRVSGCVWSWGVSSFVLDEESIRFPPKPDLVLSLTIPLLFFVLPI